MVTSQLQILKSLASFCRHKKKEYLICLERVYLLNALVLESGSLLVLQIQGRPKVAISSAGTVGERKRAELYNRARQAAGKNIHSDQNKI